MLPASNKLAGSTREILFAGRMVKCLYLKIRSPNFFQNLYTSYRYYYPTPKKLSVSPVTYHWTIKPRGTQTDNEVSQNGEREEPPQTSLQGPCLSQLQSWPPQKIKNAWLMAILYFKTFGVGYHCVSDPCLFIIFYFSNLVKQIPLGGYLPKIMILLSFSCKCFIRIFESVILTLL